MIGTSLKGKRLNVSQYLPDLSCIRIICWFAADQKRRDDKKAAGSDDSDDEPKKKSSKANGKKSKR